MTIPPRKIRVAHCIETVHLGGVEQKRLSIATGLDPERYEQMLICTKALGVIPDQLRAAGCPVNEIGTFRSRIDWRAIRRARGLMRAFRPDIVHGAVFEGVIVAALAGRAVRAPIVIGEETSDPLERRWSGHLFLRMLSTLCDRMVGVSPFVRDYLVKDLHIPAAKVALISNGVAEVTPADDATIRALKRTFGINDEHLLIGTVSRLLDSHKRVSDVIRALQSIAAERPEIRLIIVGEGPDEIMLKALAGELGVADKIVFAGYQGNPRPFYQLMDIFVHAAASEAFGLVLVEAMLASLPVVATRVGGIPGIVVDGETGLLIDSGQPGQLASAIEKLAAQPALRATMGTAGRDRARADFSDARYVQDIENLYRGVIEQRLGGAPLR